jgi:hypothetical protein
MARRHKPQPEAQPRRPTRSPKVAIDQAAKQVAASVARAYAKPSKPEAVDPGAQALEAELRAPKNTIKARPQPQPVETTKDGIIYGGKCKRCDQPISVHMKPIEGTYQLMNFYTVRCVCKGTVSIHKIGPMDHTEFEHLDPNHPRNARIESIDGVGKESDK